MNEVTGCFFKLTKQYFDLIILEAKAYSENFQLLKIPMCNIFFYPIIFFNIENELLNCKFIKILMRIHEGNGSTVRTSSTCDPRAEKVKCQISRKNPLHAYTLKGTLKQLKLRKTFKML